MGGVGAGTEGSHTKTEVKVVRFGRPLNLSLVRAARHSTRPMFRKYPKALLIFATMVVLILANR